MRTQEGACPVVYRGIWEFGWGAVHDTYAVWLVICLSSVLKQGFPTPFSSPPLFPMGQHNFVFPNLYSHCSRQTKDKEQWWSLGC